MSLYSLYQVKIVDFDIARLHESATHALAGMVLARPPCQLEK
jgi:hypothetical protein